MTSWTPKELEQCLSINLLDDIVPKLTEKERTILEDSKISDKPIIDKILQSLYAKSPRIGEFYDSSDDFRIDFEIIRATPEFYRYGKDKPGEIDKSFHKNDMTIIYTSDKSKRFVSKNDLAKMFCMFDVDTEMEVISTPVYHFWIDCFLSEKIARDLENCYELVDYSIWELIKTELRNYKFSKSFPEEVDLNKEFEGLRIYFGAQAEKYDDFMSKILIPSIKMLNFITDVSSTRAAYMEIVRIIETTIAVYKKFIEVFQPFSKSSKYQLPYVRCFQIFTASTNVDNDYLVAEVSAALKILRKNLNPQIDLESEAERKLGIVRFINEKQLEELLKSYDISKKELTIVNWRYVITSRKVLVPVISSYGTLIKASNEALIGVLCYLIRNMQLFRNIKEDALKEVVEWFKKQVNAFVHNMLHAIELWKITELIEEAKHNFSKYKPNLEIFQVPQKNEYKKKEVKEYVRKMMRPFELNIDYFEYVYSLADKMTRKTIYVLYEVCLRKEFGQLVNESNEKMSEEFRKQSEELKISSENKKDSIEMESEVAECEKLCLKSENDSELVEASNSTETDRLSEENHMLCLKYEEELKLKDAELEKLRLKFEEDLKLKDSEIEKIRLKLKEELNLKNAENEKLRLKSEEEINLKNAENERLRKQSEEELQLKNVEIENLRKKSEEDMKLKDSENKRLCLKLEEDLKLAEISKNTEIERLSKENHMLRMKFEEDLNLKNAENERLREKFSNAIKLRDAENENLSKENQKLHEKMRNFEEFFKESIIQTKNHEKLKNSERVFSLDYDGFTDSMYSNLHKIMEKHPKNGEIQKMKRELDGFDDKFDDYLENIRGEIERIQDSEEIEEEIQKLVEKCRKLIEE